MKLSEVARIIEANTPYDLILLEVMKHNLHARLRGSEKDGHLMMHDLMFSQEELGYFQLPYHHVAHRTRDASEAIRRAVEAPSLT